jgi:hypothetical protein
MDTPLVGEFACWHGATTGASDSTAPQDSKNLSDMVVLSSIVTMGIGDSSSDETTVVQDSHFVLYR